MKHKQPDSLPVVRVAVGMDPAEVMQQSTYPLNFDAAGYPFVDEAFDYRDATVTADMNVVITHPHKVRVDGIRYLGIGVRFDEVESISASPTMMTLDEAINRAREWIAEIEKAGWQRSADKSEYLYSVVKQRWFKDWNELQNNFLLPGSDKILGATIGTWYSTDGRQELDMSLIHRRPDGGVRYETTPDPEDPLNDPTYALSFSVGYTEEVRAYRGEHTMELREEALQRKAEKRLREESKGQTP